MYPQYFMLWLKQSHISMGRFTFIFSLLSENLPNLVVRDASRRALAMCLLLDFEQQRLTTKRIYICFPSCFIFCLHCLQGVVFLGRYYLISMGIPSTSIV